LWRKPKESEYESTTTELKKKKKRKQSWTGPSPIRHSKKKRKITGPKRGKRGEIMNLTKGRKRE